MAITTILAIWGSVLSTSLLGFKIWEVRRDRFKLSSSLGINVGGPDRDVIAITNDYKNPITIDGFELFWAKKLKDENTHKYVETGLEQECHILVAAYATKQLIFAEEYSFGIRPDGGNLYIRLHIAGRKKWVTQILYHG